MAHRPAFYRAIEARERKAKDLARQMALQLEPTHRPSLDRELQWKDYRDGRIVRRHEARIAERAQPVADVRYAVYLPPQGLIARSFLYSVQGRA